MLATYNKPRELARLVRAYSVAQQYSFSLERARRDDFDDEPTLRRILQVFPRFPSRQTITEELSAHLTSEYEEFILLACKARRPISFDGPFAILFQRKPAMSSFAM